MDLQDEHDKHLMHMFGINDTQFSINDFFEDLKTNKKKVHLKEDRKRV